MAFSISAECCEKHLICSICMEVFSDPRALPCMHTFCEMCLQSYISSLNSKRDVESLGFECPVCRTVTKAPKSGLGVEEWANSFTPNYTVKGLIEEHNEIHVPAMQSHSSATNQDSSNHTLGTQFCDTHPGKIADFKCEDHSPIKTCCAVCAARKHKKCGTLIYLGDDSSSDNEGDIMNENIDPELPLARRRTLSRLAHISRCEDQFELRIQNERSIKDHKISKIVNYNLTTDDVTDLDNRSSHRSLKRLFDVPRSHSFEECEDLRKLSVPYPPSNSGSSSIHIKPIMSSNQETTEVISHSNESSADDNTERRESHPSLRRLVHGPAPHSFKDNEDLMRLSAKTNRKCDSEENSMYSEESNGAMTSAARSALHTEMSVIEEIPEDDIAYSSVSAKSYTDSLLSIKSSFSFAQEVNVRHKNDIHLCSITGICSLPDGRVLIADNNNSNVKMFDANGLPKAYFKLPSSPWDVDSVGDCEAVASLPDAMCLFTVIIDDKITIGRRIDVNRKCYGVVFSDMEFIIACESDVRIMSYRGDLLTRILKEKKSVFTNPHSSSSSFRYLCVDPADSNKLYISDLNRGILCVSKQGDITSFHSVSDDRYPLGLTSSQNGVTLACQLPKYITMCIINDQGCRTKDVLCIENVQTIDLNKSDHRVWVSRSGSDTLCLYTFKT